VLRKEKMSKALLAGMEAGMTKPVNYGKFKGITEGPNENPMSFYDRLEETLSKYTNIHPTSREGGALLVHFITQLTLAIRRELQKLQLCPQTTKTQLLYAAFLVYSNLDLEEEKGTI
jgi:hypothetical protein